MELDVPKSDIYGAFGSVSDAMREGGTIRLLIAPSLGFALPRVEFIDVKGEVGTYFESTGFKEYSEGIFLPNLIVCQTNNTIGPSYRIEYDVKFEHINEAIPDSDFVLQLPAGTGVIDSRLPKNIKGYEIAERAPLPIPGMEGIIARHEASIWQRGWEKALVAGCGIGVLVAITFFIFRKRGQTI